MSSSNKKAKEKLIEIYGNECFIDKLKLRPKASKGVYTGKGQREKMKQLTYHHIQKKEHGGKSTVKNGAVLSLENHQWFNKQSPEKQAELNNIFQQYKLGILEIKGGKVINSKTFEFDYSQDYYSIPLEPNKKTEYNRAQVKRKTQKAIDIYYEKGDR